MKKIFIILAASAFLYSCKPTIEPEAPSRGQADFSTYVAIGNSLTSGFSDGTLYRSGQENSYPAMLAAQFSLVGGGQFKQPLLPGNAGWPDLKLVLTPSTDCLGNTSLAPGVYTGKVDTTNSYVSIANQGPYNNVGVPGIRCIDYSIKGYAAFAASQGAGWAARFYPDPQGNTPMEIALQKNPTFFSVWLGANDVLGYATNGGVGSVSGVSPIDISPEDIFKATYDFLIEKLVSNGAKGVLINIPDVTSVPFFTTIDPKGLVLDATQAAQLSALYAGTPISFSAGANYFIIEDTNAPGGRRQIKDGEFILITTPGDSLKCGGWGSVRPIPGMFVLTSDEVANIEYATSTFNNIIADAAAKYNLGLVDANAYLKSLESGIKWNGVTFSPQFVSGGAFSLDGIHPTPRGYALIANEIIRVINNTYKSTLPMVDVMQYNSVLFP